MPERRPADDLPMIVGFIVIRRRPAGGPAVTAGAPADRRRDIGRKFMSSAEQIGRSPNGHLAAAGRRPLPDLLRPGSRSRKSGGDLPMPKNRKRRKIGRSSDDCDSIVT